MALSYCSCWAQCNFTFINQKKTIILMTPIFLVHISEFHFKIQTVAAHHHCRRVSLLVCRRVLLSICYHVLGLLSLKCDFKISFLSLSPFPAHRYLVFAVFLFDFSLFLHFKIFLCVIFPLFLLFSFKPITRRI